MSDESFNAIRWSSLLFIIFAIKKWVVFSLTSSRISWLSNKTREIFYFLPLISNSVTAEFRFLLWIISAVTSSKTMNILFFLLGL